ncbi:MAG TPA: hypothetical protein VMS93_13800 [Candidatus Saccharimonadales bacterium]|nr:hypothetical protein [Candidatus Saccharimonadales bacterium]
MDGSRKWIYVLAGLAVAAGVAGGAVLGRQLAAHRQGTAGRDAGADSAGLASGAAPEEAGEALAAGARAQVRIESRISSESAQVGDVFEAELVAPWESDGRVVLPAGTRVSGRVAEVEATGRGKHKARLELRFTQLDLGGGREVPMDARPLVFEAGGETQRDAELIGGGAVLGGIVGKLTGNLGRGAVIGAAAGTGAALETKGQPVVVRQGRTLTLVLQREVRVPVKAPQL